MADHKYHKKMGAKSRSKSDTSRPMAKIGAKVTKAMRKKKKSMRGGY